VLNLSAGDLPGRSFFEIYRDVPDMIAQTQRVLSGDAFAARVTVGDRVVETWYSPLTGADTAVFGATGVSVDLTSRAALERRDAQAQKMEAVGRLAAGIAHDFNNLLVPVGGYAELVAATLDDADARRADLLEIRKAAERAAALTRQLLAFSRRQVLQQTVLDLNVVVRNIETLLRRTIGVHVELVLNLTTPIDPIRADATQLQQVLLNLAINARDAMPGGGQLRFSTDALHVAAATGRGDPLMAPSRYVRLTVSDTGTGMTPAVQAQVFEPFFTTKGANGGTGLGLATVYGIVKQSGGFIAVDSQLGHGTTFTIYLPAVEEAVTVPEVAERVEATCGLETILVAEDDQSVRRLTTNVLRQSGYTVLEACNGHEALAVAHAHAGTLRLLVTDLVMPGVDGRTLATRLTADHPGLRVLYTSGCAADSVPHPAQDGLPFLAKPFTTVELVRSVRQALNDTQPVT
jgi:signal transduction histidine kinase